MRADGKVVETRMDTGLANKVVLVTGASGGIGRTVVRAFAAEGARVIAHYRRSAAVAEGLARELAHCIALQADLAVEADVDRLFAAAEAKLGPVHVLIANAGFWPPDSTPIKDLSLARWHSTLDDNLNSVFLSVRAFLRGVERHKLVDPAAVFIGSTAGSFGEAGHADYAACKGAVNFGFAKSLKNELVRLAPGGRVNVVAPGWVITPGKEAEVTGNPAGIRRTLQTIPLRKLARPDDVAAACVFLSSSKLAGHLTGEVITVSGGMEGRVLFTPDEIQI
jgi:3-oxoacyl-[acyl-carrier protein] reductase